MDPAAKPSPLESAAIAILFAAGICLPLVKQLAVAETDTSRIEKRNLAPAPARPGGLRSLVREFPGEFDSYYNDHFGFRFSLLQAGALIDAECFGVSRRAIIGKNGWLFFKMDPPLFTRSLGSDDLEKWRAYLERRRQWLAARGIRYLFVVPPDKDFVYPEFLPASAGSPPAESTADQLARYLAASHSTVDILPLREAMLAAKTREQEPLYYPQDTHWNPLGGFYGYQAIMNHLVKALPTLKPRSRSDYRITLMPDNRRDIASMAALPDIFEFRIPTLVPLVPDVVDARAFPAPGTTLPPFVTQMPIPGSLPTAMVLCDSFTRKLAPYLSQNFSRITYFWPSGVSTPALEKAMADTLLKEKPDIFIEERLQRFITVVPDAKIVFGADDASPAATAP